MRRTKQCKMCEVWMEVKRSDRLTCSPKCRKRYERMCRAITEQMRADEKARQEAHRGQK